MADWTNSDGLEVRFVNPEAGQLAGGLNTMGAIKTLELDLDFVAASIAAASDSHAAFLPAGAFIVNAYVITKVAAVGGTSISIGLAAKDGTSAAPAAILSATLGVIANFNATTKVVQCDGPNASATSNIYTKFSNTIDGYVYTTKVGTFTAGQAKLIINYIERD